jgi:regulator of CtrA degradation
MSADLQEGDSLDGMSLHSFRGSALFERVFNETMALVEDCARYLDGRGVTESRALPRKASLVYAGESMRVTTRLMQAASWLLVQRAVQEGDMTNEVAASERYRLGAQEICLADSDAGVDMLPESLLDLLTRSEKLYRRIARFDDLLFQQEQTEVGVQSQFAKLAAAFPETTK